MFSYIVFVLFINKGELKRTPLTFSFETGFLPGCSTRSELLLCIQGEGGGVALAPGTGHNRLLLQCTPCIQSADLSVTSLHLLGAPKQVDQLH